VLTGSRGRYGGGGPRRGGRAPGRVAGPAPRTSARGVRDGSVQVREIALSQAQPKAAPVVALAAQLAVSRDLVIEAYQQLQAERYLDPAARHPGRVRKAWRGSRR
jgi:hypothetical protein